MKCPFCAGNNTEVIDSREVMDGASIRRRRECESCGRRFTTYEKVDLEDISVIKRDGTRQPFDRNKILSGVIKACEKRNITREKMDSIVEKIEMKIRSKGIKEINSRKIGDMVVKELSNIDPIAYIRFASVYYNFDSPKEFKNYVLMLERSTKKKK